VAVGGRGCYGTVKSVPFVPPFAQTVLWRIFVTLAWRLSSRPPRNLFGGMDELDAAASVLAMEVDSDAEEDQELGAAPGESSDDIGLRTFSEPSSENKENHIDQPASGEVGAAQDKVTSDP
jgi:hypothetical protein